MDIYLRKDNIFYFMTQSGNNPILFILLETKFRSTKIKLSVKRMNLEVFQFSTEQTLNLTDVPVNNTF